MAMARKNILHQRGFSLIELMISMVIGLVVVGAVFAAYLGTSTSSSSSRAVAQMTEDASLAMNVLRSQIAMAGFSAPTGIDGSGKFTKNYTGMAVNGCSSEFADTTVGIDALTCSGAGSDSIAVEFEADARNSVVSSSGAPLDCLGNGITIAGSYYLSYSRFYINGGKLYCRGSGSNTADALIDNIDSMVIQYGVANAATPNQVSYYSRASGMNASEFNLAISARVCLIVKSEREVADTAVQYYDCDGTEQTAPDRRLYKAFTSTITLQNRMGLN